MVTKLNTVLDPIEITPLSTTSLQFSVTPSTAPPAGLTNPQLVVVMNGGNLATEALTLSPSPCSWTSASPIVCSVDGLTGATGYRFQMVLKSDETSSETIIGPTAMAYTMLSQTVSTPVTSNPGQSTMQVTVQASAAPPGSFTNPHFRFYQKGTTTALSTTAPCLWTSTASVTCTLSGLSAGTSYEIEASLATDQAVGAKSEAASTARCV